MYVCTVSVNTHQDAIFKKLKSRVKAYFSSLNTLTEDEDRSTGNIGVPPPDF